MIAHIMMIINESEQLQVFLNQIGELTIEIAADGDFSDYTSCQSMSITKEDAIQLVKELQRIIDEEL